MYTGPNIERDGLVFGYDTGYPVVSGSSDTYRFNLGEPTINLLSSPTDMEGTGWSLGNVSSQITITGNQPDPFGGNNAILFTVAADGGNYPHIRQIDKITGTTASHTISIWAKSKSGSTRLDLVCFRSSPWNTAFSKTVTLTTVWQKFEVTGTPLDITGHRIYFMCQNVSSGTAAEVYMAYPQTEQKSHATPFVNGTRSVSGSLIDLIKTTDIDLSNVSFDSNAQLTFDGTDDYIDCGTQSGLDSGDVTIEFVAKVNTSNAVVVGKHYNNFEVRIQSTLFGGYVGHTGGWREIDDANVAHGVNILNYNHYTYVFSYNTNNLYMYANGEYKGTFVGTSQGVVLAHYSIGENLEVGRRFNGTAYLDGEVPVLKAYNRALTAAEVQQNFKAYKNRFNI